MSGANPGLAYDDTPPFSAPLRFFLSAPLFGIAAGFVLMLDDTALTSRWTPGALAAVHLIATGVMLQVMLGALMQILPVAAGAPLMAPLRIATATHAVLTVGSVGLSWGLWRGQPEATFMGAILLALGLGIFLGAATIALRRAPETQSQSRAPRDLRFALLGLAATATLGIALVTALTRGTTLPLSLLTLVNLHAGWGWMGWGAILLAATSWVVVPMFQITPGYPALLTRIWAPMVFTLLVLWSISAGLSLDIATLATAAALCVLAAAFAITTLRLQARSRRSTPDDSFLAFRVAMVSGIAGVLAILVSLVAEAGDWPLLAGILILHGGFVGAISAMLYKVVPFLAWLHLTQAGIKAPNMKKLSPSLPVRRQLHVHALALAALTLAVFVPPASPLAGAAVTVEFAWLCVNLLRIVRAWRRAGGQWNAGKLADGKNCV